MLLIYKCITHNSIITKVGNVKHFFIFPVFIYVVCIYISVVELYYVLIEKEKVRRNRYEK